MEIIPYSERYFEPLICFMRKNWAPNHSIYSKDLFDWQYGGPDRAGPDMEPSSCMLLVDGDGDVRGFLGVIAYPFFFCDVVMETAGLAMWVVDKDIMNSGAGLYLRKAVEDRFDIVYTIGINPAVVRYYERRQYQYYDSLNRYVIPLDAGGYQSFLSTPCAPNDVAAWLTSIMFPAPAVSVASISADVLERTYMSGVAPRFTLLPKKDAKFWQWRYLDSKGFSYLFAQGDGGVVVFRVEDTLAPGNPLLHGVKCLRLIEILPADGAVWDGEASPALAETVLSVLAWGKKQGCVLADFQISNGRLEHILRMAGFRPQQAAGITDIAMLFSPYRANASPLNFTYRVRDNGVFVKVDREDTYIVKSDTDMDRPNYLGKT